MKDKHILIHISHLVNVKKKENTKYRHLTISATSELGAFISGREMNEDNGTIEEEEERVNKV